MDSLKLRGTFLVQYDALLMPEFTDLLKTLDPARYELGVWHEIVEQMVRAVGIEWRGRFTWDWHCHCGFSVGYTGPQRETLADELFSKFREVFGYLPRVFGSWLFDTHTAEYICGKYDPDAMCICKEQYGTDGYTLWGGYYGQAYYPSKSNIFIPAQSRAMQLDTPVFRMLGSDPVRQYDFGLDMETGADRVQKVITLEPVCQGSGGGSPEWVDWFLRENFNGECLSFGYAQAGQENSFGWSAMKAGLEYQFRRFAEMRDTGAITVEPLGETGRKFRAAYSSTPASAIVAHTAFDDPLVSSVWYSSSNYRINLYCDHGRLRIRDLHVFSWRVRDSYADEACSGDAAAYETLPVIDGNRFSGRGVLAGAFLTGPGGADFPVGEMRFSDTGRGRARVTYGDGFTAELAPDRVSFIANREFMLENRIGDRESDHLPEVVYSEQRCVRLMYNRVEYGVRLYNGRFVPSDAGYDTVSERGEIKAEILTF